MKTYIIRINSYVDAIPEDTIQKIVKDLQSIGSKNKTSNLYMSYDVKNK